MAFTGILADALNSFGIANAGIVVGLGIAVWHGRELLGAGAKAATWMRALFVFVSILIGALAVGVLDVDGSRLASLGSTIFEALTGWI
jgi:hypothetical protein